MSVRNETYLMFAVQLDVKKTFEHLENNYEKCDPFRLPYLGREASGKIGYLADGMGGKYVLFGEVIAVKNEEGDEDFGLLDIDVVLENLQATSEEIIFNKLGEMGTRHLALSNGCKLYLVSHYH